MLNKWGWKMTPYRIVGHNTIGFDLPYLVRSSIYNGVKVPTYLTALGTKGKRYWPECYIDSMVAIAAGEYGYKMSLDRLAKVLGYEGKNGDGKNFYKMDRATQESYLENDLRQVKYVFEDINKSLGLADNDKVLYFDIETAPRDTDEIARIAPDFNPNDVKVGNLKDEEKIKAKIEDARANHLNSYINKAGLNAEYSQPIAIGYIHPGISHDYSMELDFSEPKKLLERFWQVVGWVWGQQPEKLEV